MVKCFSKTSLRPKMFRSFSFETPLLADRSFFQLVTFLALPDLHLRVLLFENYAVSSVISTASWNAEIFTGFAIHVSISVLHTLYFQVFYKWGEIDKEIF